jgi:23S rRNA pseudouridine1911/1915/1917 synthase
VSETGERRSFRADRGDVAHRLDRVLVRHLADLPWLSRTRLQAWIAAGHVRVNGTPAGRPSDRLALGDQVEIDLPPPPAARPAPAAQEMPLDVLYEDAWLLAVAKPPGLVVHPTPGQRDGTLLNALLWHLQGEGRPGLVNRLDRWTSGVLLAAKSGEVHGRLARALRAKTAVKEYLAVVYGVPPLERGRIERPLLRDPEDRRRMAVGEEGRPSVTLWETVATSAGADGEGVRLSLLRCRLLTGRMHQIRVHLAAEGLPLVGDPLYGEPRWKGVADPALAAACRDFPRQALHAERIACLHPQTGAALEVAAPLPEDLRGLLAAAGFSPALPTDRD